MTYITNKDPFLEIAIGNTPDKLLQAFGGNTQSLSAGVEETVWDQGGLLTLLTADTQLYISSSSAADVGIVVVVTGFLADLTAVNRIVVTNGQNQVALSGLIMIVEVVAVVSATPAGDLYVAETDSLTGGVPDTTSKIQGKVIQGNNTGINSVAVITVGTTAFIRGIEYTTGKLKDIDIIIKFTPFGGITRNFPRIHLAEAPAVLNKEIYTAIPGGSILQLNAIAKDDNASLSAAFYYTEVENI